MKKILKIVVLMFIVSMITLTSCNPQKKISGYTTFQTECLNVELDGSQTVKVWGQGRDKKDAIEQAKKNGIRDILFKGIRSGKSDCESRPVIFEVNAQENHKEYFDRFFRDNGSYNNFISMADTKTAPDEKLAGEQVTYGVIVRILRNQLKNKMIDDKIINQY